MAESTTTRMGLRRWSADTDTPSRDEFDGGHATLEQLAVGYTAGTLALRPAPGLEGWLYYVDSGASVGKFYYDTGAAWLLINPDWGLVGDISASAVGDTALAGATQRWADAAHRHAREGFGAAVATTKFGLAKSDGAASDLARRDHGHGTPGLQSAGADVTSRSKLNFAGFVVSDDAGGDRTTVTLPFADAAPASLALGTVGSIGTSPQLAREDHGHDVSRTLPSYNELYHDVTATTATTTLDCSTSVNKRITLQANTTLAFANVPTGCAFSMTLWLIEDAVGGRTVTFPAGSRNPSGVAPGIATGANARNVITITTFDGGSTWDVFFSGRDMR
jgi:hypothetical protein